MVCFWYHHVVSAKFTLGQVSRLYTRVFQRMKKESVTIFINCESLLTCKLGEKQTAPKHTPTTLCEGVEALTCNSQSRSQTGWVAFLVPFLLRWESSAVSHTLTDAAMRRMERMSHFYPALVLKTGNGCPNSTTMMLRQSCRCGPR